MQIFKV